MCVTSPPYWGLRDYGVDGQLGLESTIEEFVGNMVEVFGLVRELLADDGTLWLNLGDSYANVTGGAISSRVTKNVASPRMRDMSRFGKLKTKDLCGVPWRVAFALQSAGWWLRQDIIWHKPNPMPESIKDRCTKSHEYLFLMAKSERYLCDMDAIAEPATTSTIERLSQPNLENQEGSARVPGKTNGNMKAVGGRNSFARKTKDSAGEHGQKPQFRDDREPIAYEGTRNKRSVWTVPTQSYSEAHFATYPPALIEPCILAGSRPGDIVFDPFMGSGTTAQVAMQLGRRYLGCELNPEYARLADDRTKVTPGFQFATEAA